MKQIVVNTLAEFKAKLEAKDLSTAKAIYESVKRGVVKNYKTVNVFDVTLKEDPLSVYKFKLEKSQWPVALTTCMDIFSEHELFEECVDIQKMLKDLESVAK